MIAITWFFARRFIRASHADATLSRMTLVCFLSIFIGSCALALIIAIMRGIEVGTHERLQSIHPDITIQADEQLNYAAVKTAIQHPGIQAIAPRTINYGILSPATDESAERMVMIVGIDPEEERYVSPVMRSLSTILADTASPLALPPTIPEIILPQGGIVIGERLAHLLHLHRGDRAYITHTRHGVHLTNNQADDESEEDTVMQTKVTIVGYIKTGNEEIDAQLIVGHIAYLAKMFDNQGVSHIGVKLRSPRDTDPVLIYLKQKLSCNVYSWKELFPAAVSALILERYAMLLILILILIVASMSITSLLFVFIQQKQKDIALLQSMGMPYHTLYAIFLSLGQLIALTAAGLGIITATIAAYCIEHYLRIPLPDVYYISTLPARMELDIVIMVLCIVLGLTALALVLPLQRIKRITIAHTLQHN